MKEKFFVVDYDKNRPWIMATYAKKKRTHDDPGFKSWEEPLGPILLRLYDEGDFWPDHIGGGFTMPGFYVSERVKKSLDKEGVKYDKAFPASVWMHELPPALKNVPPPKYYWLYPLTGVEIDLTASGFVNIRRSPTTGLLYGDLPDRLDPCSLKEVAFVDGSWTGADLFVSSRSPSRIFCTRRIIDLASKHRWTNFKFVPIEHVYDRPFHPGIPY